MLAMFARYVLRNDENFKKLDTELDKPEVWDTDWEYTIEHEDGFELWMANGIWSFRVRRPIEIPFSFWMKLALWGKAKKIKRGRREKPSKQLAKILDKIKP